MGRRIKLKDDTYLDDSSIHHNGVIQKQVIEEILTALTKPMQHRGNISTLDDIYKTGIYRFAAGANTTGASQTPTGEGYGILVVFTYRDWDGSEKPDYTVQFFLPNGDSYTWSRDTIYIRTSISGAWRQWVPLTTAYETNESTFTGETKDGHKIYTKIVEFDTTLNGSLEIAHEIEGATRVWFDPANSYFKPKEQDYRFPFPNNCYYGNFNDRYGGMVDLNKIYLYSDTGWGTNWWKVICLRYTLD